MNDFPILIYSLFVVFCLESIQFYESIKKMYKYFVKIKFTNKKTKKFIFIFVVVILIIFFI